MDELKYCKNCINAKPKQGEKFMYCSKHRRWITEYTGITTYVKGNGKECEDYTEEERT